MRAGAVVVAAAGLLGALAASCETVDLGAPPSDINVCRPSQQYFVETIWPMVLAKDYGGRHCYDSMCHGGGSSNSLKLAVPTAADPSTIPLTGVWAANYRATTQQMNCTNVKASALIELPEGLKTHGGQRLFPPGSAEETAIIMWVTATP
jgi:hypothetical protein